ncbi:acetyl-CoA synthetase-like protein [Xylariaceae sp. FL0804]|nr:acetyl-CoA synthetase-like protein [Xylariaceae sp. FL0804]
MQGSMTTSRISSKYPAFIGTHLTILSPPMVTSPTCLQDVLRHAAESREAAHLKFYVRGSTANPTSISYRSLYGQARQNSLRIRSLPGFGVGRPVLIHLDDHASTIVWFWSALIADGLPVLSSPFSNDDEARRRHTSNLSSLLESPICITSNHLKYLFDGDHTFHVLTVEALSQVNAPDRGPEAFGERAGRDACGETAFLMLTSGSTGAVKAVRLSHRQVLSAVAGKASVRALPAGSPFLNWIGLDHVASLVEIHIQALWLGVHQVHVPATDVLLSPTTFLDLLDRHAVSRSFAPNFFLAKLVSAAEGAPPAARWDLSSLTILASGGEANDTETCVAASALFRRCGARRDVITPGFGMTETCAGAIFNLDCPEYDVAHGLVVASLGQCMAGIEMRVTDPVSGAPAAVPDKPGNLEVRGDVVFEGYYRDPKATLEAFTQDGWFRTGDQAVIDPMGHLRMIGRVKDVININGVKFPSADVQTSLEQTLGSRVARLICFPARAADTERVTVAYIPNEWPMRSETRLEIESLATQACMASVSSLPTIFCLSERSVPLLPMSTLGKISRPKLRTLYEAGAFSADVAAHREALQALKQQREEGSPARAASEAETALMVDITQTLGTIDPSSLSVDTSIFDLGVTSIHMIQLKHRIDGRLGRSVPLITIIKNPTASSLAAALGLVPSAAEAPPVSVLGSDVDDDNAHYDPVVPLRPTGHKTPLWLFHPGVGEVLVFVGLARHLAADDRPVYALRARGFEPGQTRFADIPETVDAYVAAVRARQPRGPYALAGYSYGTMLAFEVAKRLDAEADGGSGPAAVQFLGSFNLPPHIKTRMRQLSWNMCLVHLAQFLGLVAEAQADAAAADAAGFGTLGRAVALERVLGAAAADRMVELGLDAAALERWADVAYGLQSMAVDYEPAGAVAAIDVFHARPLSMAAASREEWVGEHLSRWRDFCRTEPRFHAVGGAHYTMIDAEHVVGFAAVLREALEARGL